MMPDESGEAPGPAPTTTAPPQAEAPSPSPNSPASDFLTTATPGQTMEKAVKSGEGPIAPGHVSDLLKGTSTR